jgi:hypothetical protein
MKARHIAVLLFSILAILEILRALDSAGEAYVNAKGKGYDLLTRDQMAFQAAGQTLWQDAKMIARLPHLINHAFKPNSETDQVPAVNGR